MQITSTAVETTSNYTPDETVVMGFHEASRGVLLNQLIKQYTDPYIAAFREYTSNARDSHQKSGQTLPVEVTLPNEMASFLTIEDFGTGLDREQMKGFGQFGQSDKRDSNEYTGGFGLGSKSGLAMASSFTVTAVKDGKRNTAIVTRNADGAPEMQFPFPEQDATGERNGVKITIPTNENERFRAAIRQGFFMGWKPGSILVDGSDPTASGDISVYDEKKFEALPNGLGWLRKGAYDDRGQRLVGDGFMLALINGVKYTINLSKQNATLDYQLLRGFYNNIVMNIENGAVTIHGSREDVIYDKQTREYLTSRIEAIRSTGARRHQEAIDAAPGYREALVARETAQRAGFKASYTYKGKAFVFTSSYNHIPNNVTIGSTLTLVNFNTRQDYYTSQRNAIPYSYQINEHNILQLARQKSILVFGAPIPPKPKDNYSRDPHATSSSALAFIRGFVGSSEKLTDYHVVFTSLPLKSVDESYRNAFLSTISHNSYLEKVEKGKKERAAELRAAREAGAGPRVAAPKAPTQYKIVRMTVASKKINYVTQAELSKDFTYVLLKSGDNRLVDHIRDGISAPIYGGYGPLKTIITAMHASNKYRFVYANSNTNVEKWGEIFPNYEPDVAKAMAKFVKGTWDGWDTDARLTYFNADETRNLPTWMKTFPENRVNDITNKETRKWLGGKSSVLYGKEIINSYNSLVSRGIFKIDGLKIEKPVVPPVDNSKLIAARERYALLEHVNPYTMRADDWDPVVEYINMKDKFTKKP